MTTVVVTFVLVMVLVSGRFIKHLAQAAAGELPAEALFLIMAFRLPEFLQMILPLSIYVAVLLVLGRMHVDNEIAVQRACGIGPLHSARAMLVPILMATSLIAAFSLYVTPRGDAEVARIFDEQDSRSALELLSPGRFHTRFEDRGQRATYAQSLDKEQGTLQGVFISEFRKTPSGQLEPVTVRAQRGRIVDQGRATYLLLEDGVQYRGTPGNAALSEVRFEQAYVLVDNGERIVRPPKVRGWPTEKLLGSERNEARAELQWRLSLIVLVPVMILAAIPLSKTNPRQGRFLRLAPAMLGYMVYIGLLLVLRSRMSDAPEGELPPWVSMAWVHLGAILVVVALYNEYRLRRWLRVRREARS